MSQLENHKKEREPFEAYVCVILFSLLVIVLSMEVVARYIFSNSFRWSEELARYLFIWLIFISASYAVVKKAHIHIESLLVLLPKKVKPYAMLLGKFVWLAFTVFVVYIGTQQTLTVLNSSQISPGLQIPLYIVYLAIPVGYLLMSIRIIQQLIEDVKELFGTNTLEQEGRK